MTLWVPPTAAVTQVDPKEGSDPVLVALDERHYIKFSGEGNGIPYPYGSAREEPLPARMRGGLRRFGAAHEGRVYLRIRHAGQVHLVRLDIAAATEAPRGHRVVGTESTPAGTTLSVDGYDSLELELPGNPADGWSVTAPAESGFRLESIESVESATPVGAAPAQARVVLRFSASSAVRGGGSALLLVKRKGGEFRFTVERRPTPRC